MKKYYDILGLDTSASMEEIKKAYRKLSMKTHPDKGGNDYLFKEVNKAYEHLKKNHDKESEGFKYETPNNYTYEGEYNTDDKTKDSKRHSSIKYLLKHKISSIIKVAFIILLYIGLLNEYGDPKIQEFISISFVLFIYIALYYNKNFSKVMGNNIFTWFISYFLYLALPIGFLLYIEKLIEFKELSIIGPIVIGMFMYLCNKPLKDNTYFVKLRTVVYIVFLLQILSYFNIL